MEMALCVLDNCLVRPKLPQWSPLRSLVSSLVSPWLARIQRYVLSRTQHRRTDGVVHSGRKRSSPPAVYPEKMRRVTRLGPKRQQYVTETSLLAFFIFRTLATTAG